MSSESQNSFTEGFRLSPQQRRLWQLDGANSNSAFRVVWSIRVDGAVDSGQIEAALNTLIQRHEILRTSLHSLPDLTLPVQVVSDECHAVVEQFDVTNLSPTDQTSKIDQVFDAACKVPFDLQQQPAFNASWITISPSHNILVLAFPGYLMDSTGISLLVQELSRILSSQLDTNEESEEVLQYADLAEWQSSLFDSEDAEQGIGYWQDNDRQSPVMEFDPSTQVEDGSATFKPALHRVELESELTTKIAQFLTQREISESIFFLSCWQVLLSRRLDQSTFTIGMGCDGRTYEELSSAMGLFARFIPHHCSLEQNLSFEQLLESNQNRIGEMLQWQEYFSWEHFALAKDAELQFFPLCFDYEDHSEPITSDQVTSTFQRHYICTEPFQIKLVVCREDEKFVTELYYDANRVHRDEIIRLANQLHALAESAADQPTAPIAELNLLNNAERSRVLVEFNQTVADYPSDKRIHDLISEVAHNSSSATAVVSASDQLTYAQLDQRSNQLANHLRNLGVGRDQLVGLCVNRSSEMLVGILGILKAGGAYLPLDPVYPTERLKFMLQDTGASVLITQQSLEGSLPEHEAKLVCIDSDWGEISSCAATPVADDATSESLAYVIYTSGSTGTPKGVEITHRNLVHSTTARTSYYQDHPDRYLLLSSFAFDSSVAGIFWTLCVGGALVLLRDGDESDPSAICNAISQHQVSHLLGLPSLYGLLLDDSNRDQLSSLRTAIVAGEACPVSLIERHLQMLPKTALFNEYGPTEGTVWSTVFDCRDFASGRTVPIGRPITNTRAYLLDPRSQPVPIGVRGELYIGGEGLARGYLNRSELTAERFVQSAISEAPGQRLYRTGDVGRYLPDGNIEFLGRVDNQVKVRGYRIELEEVEEVLRQNGSVRDVAVIVREDTPGDQRLVGYIVAAGTAAPTVGELQRFLRTKLPEFMVPSSFVTLQSLPLMPNGKVDRAALPEPDSLRPKLDSEYVAPGNAIEQVLVGLWMDVLGKSKIGVHDNFFELGGHSILVTQFVARLRETFRIDLPLGSVFEAPTVAELSVRLLDGSDASAELERTAELILQVAEMPEEDVQSLLDQQAS